MQNQINLYIRALFAKTSASHGIEPTMLGSLANPLTTRPSSSLLEVLLLWDRLEQQKGLVGLHRRHQSSLHLQKNQHDQISRTLESIYRISTSSAHKHVSSLEFREKWRQIYQNQIYRTGFQEVFPKFRENGARFKSSKSTVPACPRDSTGSDRRVTDRGWPTANKVHCSRRPSGCKKEIINKINHLSKTSPKPCVSVCVVDFYASSDSVNILWTKN